MDHHFRAGAQGKLEGLDDKYYFGRRPNGFYIPRYRNLFGDKRSYLRGFGYQGGAGRDDWGRAVAELGVGGAFKDAMAMPGGWNIGGTAFGEMLPNHNNKITIDNSKKDKWGMPVIAIDCATGENEHAMRRQVQIAELLQSALAAQLLQSLHAGFRADQFQDRLIRKQFPQPFQFNPSTRQFLPIAAPAQ